MSKKPLKNKVFSILTVLFTLLMISVPCTAAPSGGSINMEIKGGYNDTAVIGYYNPFTVTLRNNGNEFVGELQVVVGTIPEGRTAFAVPCNLPKGSTKVFTVNALISTVNRKVEIRLAKGSKIVKSDTYQLKKLISPETSVIGVLCEDPDGLVDLKGASVQKVLDPTMSRDIAMKMNYAYQGAASETIMGQGKIAEIISLDSKSFPDNVKALSAFNALVISNYDTSTLSENQKTAIEAWVNSGGKLFIGTGPNWKKVYTGLPDSLIPFKIQSSTTISTGKNFASYTNSKENLTHLNIVTGTPGSGKVILQESGYPLSIVYKEGSGIVSILSFDPSLNPVSGWVGARNLWEKLINESADKIDLGSSLLYVDQNLSNFQSLANNVPESQTPPYGFLMAAIILYIIITGPILYWLLKWRDKRDLSWIIIPVMAFVFMGIVYTVGFKTRFTSAVLNNVSVINIDGKAKVAETKTFIGAFNNTKGTMKISCDDSLNIDETSNNLYNSGRYVSYNNPQNGNTNNKIISKYVYGNEPTYEIYDVSLWTPVFLKTSKEEPVKDKILDSVTISNGVFKANIKNNTNYSFKEAFISIGTNFIEVGNIKPGEEKKLEVVLASKATKSFERLLNDRYGQPYYSNPRTPSKTDREKTRKREILQNFYNSYNIGGLNRSRYLFCAMNDDPVSYNIKVNSKKPKAYNTNIIFSLGEFDYKKGGRVEIPKGVIIPAMDDSGNGNGIEYTGDPYGGTNGIIFHSDRELGFTFKTPESVETDGFKVSFLKSQSPNMKYQPPNAPKPSAAKNQYKYFIYNNSTSAWEEISEEFNVPYNVKRFISDKQEIKVKVSVTVDTSAVQSEMLSYPEIELSGVAK